jgi:hypothetical protein
MERSLLLWGPRRDWQEVDKYNENYERFYNELGIVPAEDREAFWAALRSVVNDGIDD